MPSYEYGKLYVLTVTNWDMFAPAQTFHSFPGYLVETQGRKLLQSVGFFGGGPTLLDIANNLGQQGWSIHSEVIVNAPTPTWMNDMIKKAAPNLKEAIHNATHWMTRRAPIFFRSRITSIQSLGGIDLTPAS